MDEVHAEEDQGLRSQDIVGVSLVTIPLLKACEYHYPSSVPLAVIKYFDQISWGGKGLFVLQVEVHQEVKTTTWKQELKQRLWMTVAYWIALTDLLNFL